MMHFNPVPIILIVDDYPINLNMLFKLLSQMNYSVRVATNGPRALELAKKETPDLILLDIMMPEMDGFEVCRQLKQDKNCQDIPIIFLTALNENESILKGFEVGGVDYIIKPFRHEEALARINTHVTLRRQQQLLVQQKEELLTLNASKDRFYSIISHDLKGPMGGLMTLSAGLYHDWDQVTPDDLRNTLATFAQTSENTYNLLTNLLEWISMQQGKIFCRPTIFKLKDAVAYSVSIYTEQARQKNIQLHDNMNDDLYVHADYEMVNTILRNLIQNSIKFTRPGGQIAIRAEKTQFAQVTITDTGIGISPENLARLFLITEKVKTRGTNAEPGTGLGLILIKDLIERNGGNIWVESEVGKGSSFTFSLPLAAPENIKE